MSRRTRDRTLEGLNGRACGVRGEAAQPGEHKKYRRQTQANNRAQQPAQVIARRAQHRMQRIAALSFKPTTSHAMVLLQVANDRFDCLASLEPAPLWVGQRLVFATVNQL